MGRRRFALSWAVLIALLAIAVRVPFLFKAPGFFNSDEAVEGLMARHLESLPVFFWGQGYKGVPEVYLYAVVFAALGSGVVQLKATVLALWALAVVAVARLAWAWYGAAVMIVTVALLVVGTPAMTYWSLSANAEVVLLTGLTAAMFLLWWPAPGQRTTPRSAWAFVLAGLALWIHPVAACALVAMAIAAALDSDAWRTRRWTSVVPSVAAKNLSGWIRPVALVLHGLFAVLIVAFTAMYLGLTVRGGVISATHPQRLLKYIAAVGAAVLLVHAFGQPRTRRRAGIATGAFLIGALPVIVELTRGGGVGTPVITRFLTDLPWMLRAIGRELMPAFLGFADVGGGPVDVAWWTCLPFLAALAVGAARAIRGRVEHPERLLPLLTIGAAFGLLTIGGGFSGAPTLRYLLPFYGLITMVAAVGIVRLAAGRALWIAAMTALCLAPVTLAELRWHSMIFADASDGLLVSCLSRQPKPFARADYWIAYRLTFLAGERVLIVPEPDQDRYAPYRETAEAAGALPRVEYAYLDGAVTPASGPVICESPLLRLVQ